MGGVSFDALASICALLITSTLTIAQVSVAVQTYELVDKHIRRLVRSLFLLLARAATDTHS